MYVYDLRLSIRIKLEMENVSADVTSGKQIDLTPTFNIVFL